MQNYTKKRKKKKKREGLDVELVHLIHSREICQFSSTLLASLYVYTCTYI
jgi:hypothetical protein